MNILFFLTPKSEVAFIESTFTLRQILEKMEIHRYSAIPILSGNVEAAVHTVGILENAAVPLQCNGCVVSRIA